jgi:hypothetical protein
LSSHMMDFFQPIYPKCALQATYSNQFLGDAKKLVVTNVSYEVLPDIKNLSRGHQNNPKHRRY